MGDEEVGSITVEPREGSLELYNMRILPDRQGLGLGTTLVRDVLTRASQEELPVNLRVLKANPRAKSFYERMGIEVIGETETHHRMRANPTS